MLSVKYRKPSVKILGDSQIRLFDELFSHLGDTATYSGRTITAEQLQGVDALITRSTVKVDQTLLGNSSVQFVGTCTIGTDHFDTQYLDQQNITWTNAAGCNANSVVQYVLSAMAQLAPNWKQSTVGIIACGNIGGGVYRRLRSLGVNCRVYDPFLSQSSSSDSANDFTSLEAVLQCDIITSHAPLTTDGAYPTHHLLGKKELDQLREGCLLISAGRGAVVDNHALFERLTRKKDIRVALDVWENEPHIMEQLIPLVDIATPHIAGHSLEGKENGTVMVYQKLCEHLQMTSPVDTKKIVDTQTTVVEKVIVDKALVDDSDTDSELMSNNDVLIKCFNALLLHAYPIMQDDQRFRDGLSSDKSFAEHFDFLRKNYPIRREYSHFVFPEASLPFEVVQWLTILTTSDR